MLDINTLSILSSSVGEQSMTRDIPRMSFGGGISSSELKTTTCVYAEEPMTQASAFVGSAWLEHLRSLASSWVVIADHRAWSFHGKAFLNCLKRLGARIEVFMIPSGEQSKTREVKQELEDRISRANLGSSVGFIGFGGGVVTDLTGFIAATWMRGCPLVFVPTTLLSMVDASIGGKNGVNLGLSKNRIGTMYLPNLVLIEPSVLHTLEDDQWRDGWVETLKHALLSGPDFLATLLDHWLTKGKKSIDISLVKTTRHAKEHILTEAACLRTNVPCAFRDWLNLGHTMGHAIEAVTEHRISHGHAVGMGLLFEAKLAVEQGVMRASAFSVLQRALIALDDRSQVWSLPKGLSLECMKNALNNDKKQSSNSIVSSRSFPFVVLQEIGLPYQSSLSGGVWPVSESVFDAFWDTQLEDANK